MAKLEWQDKEECRRRFVTAFTATGIFYFFVHGYRAFHNMYSGDALVDLYQADYAWQIALGRCFDPIWLFLRGTLLSPWLLSILAMCFLCLTVGLTADYLEMRGVVPVALLSAVMTGNVVLTCMNASFLPWLDLYVLTLLLNAAGVWCLEKKRIAWFLGGTVLLTLGLGTYQSYITFAIALVMIKLLMSLSEKGSQKEILKWLVRCGIAFLLAGLLYYGSWKLIQKCFHIWTADSYNGMASLWDYSECSIPSLLVLTYKKVLDFFWNPDVFVSLYFRGQSLSVLWVWALRIMTIAAVVLAVGMLVYKNVKYHTTAIQRVFQAVLVVLFPLGINSICVITKGTEHMLMIYAFLAVYMLAIRLAFDNVLQEKKKHWIKALAIVCIAVIFWENAVYANQVYVKRKLQEDAALSLMTRVLYDVEHSEGYIPGETPVAISGYFSRSPEIKDPEGLSDVGMYNTAVFYQQTPEAFLRYYMNANVALTSLDPNLEEIQNMPLYPQKGSVAYVGDVLVIKISE